MQSTAFSDADSPLEVEGHSDNPFAGLIEAAATAPPRRDRRRRHLRSVPDPVETPAVATAPEPEPAPVLRPVKPPMAERIKAEQGKDPHAHTWVVAAEVPIDIPTARYASYRGSFRTEDGMRVDALEVYCRGCRRPLDEVRDDPCAAKIDNTHLIGGDQSVRAKRNVPEIRGVIKKQVIDRRRMPLGGYSVHAGR